MNSQSAANVTECATQVSSGALWRLQITRNDNLPQLQVDGKPRWRMTPPSAARTHRRTGGKHNSAAAHSTGAGAQKRLKLHSICCISNPQVRKNAQERLAIG